MLFRSFLALLAALTFAVATLGINVVANFVSPAFDFANVFPRTIDFKKGGYIAALIALVLLLNSSTCFGVNAVVSRPANHVIFTG